MAFDMETRGLGGAFIICAFMGSDGIRYIANTLSDAFFFILEHPDYRYLAHNASGYEFAYLYYEIKKYFDEHEDVEIEPTLQGESRIVQFRITIGKGRHRTRIDLRDTLCLFNTSLSNVAGAYCPDLPKGEPPWNKKHDNFDPLSDVWMQYLWRDCEIVLVAYTKLRDMIWEVFHCKLGVTAGRTAMNAYQTCIPDGHVYYRVSKETETFIRRAYYGAAVFPGHQIGDWGATASVDINGAYAYQMGSHKYPVGAPAHTHKYVPGHAGIYQVIATVPFSIYEDLGFNPIPHRRKGGLVWESGTFETTITNIEIDYAIAHGCSITVLWGYVWFREELVFKDFVEKCQELELKDNGLYKPAIKLIRNSCYGKFGTKPVHNKIIFSKDGFPKDIATAPMLDAHTGKWIPGVFLADEETEAPYILPMWACFITAYQRVYLFTFIEACYKAGATNVYCDTDSIKCDAAIILQLINNKIIPIGTSYGQFKPEGVFNEFIVMGPKSYYGEDSKGNKELKAKGIPKQLLTRQLYTDALTNNRKQSTFISVKSLKSIIQDSGIGISAVRKRTMTDIKNSFSWRIDEQNRIYPNVFRDEYCYYPNEFGAGT